MKKRSAGNADPAPAPGTLPDLLARVDKWLAKHRRRFAKALRPGAKPDEIAALQSELGQAPPDELRVWLAWHNGQDPDVYGTFESNWSLLSTKQIADAKKEQDKQASPDWNAAWVPFLGDDDDNCVCIDTRQPGLPVREWWPSTAQHSVVAPSLTAWVADFLAALERGEYAEDPERGTFYRRRS